MHTVTSIYSCSENPNGENVMGVKPKSNSTSPLLKIVAVHTIFT